MKVFTCDQIRLIDRYTIENEPVASHELMERAAGKLFDWISARYSRNSYFIVFAGTGNNGGDGLALARMLFKAGFNSRVICLMTSKNVSPDRETNFRLLQECGYPSPEIIEVKDPLPAIPDGTVIIDAIFGSGLTRPAEGLAEQAINMINMSGNEVISVDIPSGLFCEDNTMNSDRSIIRAAHTLSFQFPKLAMFFPENFRYTGDFHILPIGLHREIIEELSTPYNYVTEEDVAGLIRQRKKFDHKGVFGHGLLVAGSKSKAGAAVLASRAALRTGIGLLTCHTASDACAVIQAAVPEAMTQPDINNEVISSVGLTGSFNACAIGPGLGLDEKTKSAVRKVLSGFSGNMVIDADAINIISGLEELKSVLRQGMILTPHLKEFERIAGKSEGAYSRLMLQRQFAMKHGVIVVLKGAHTAVALPDGRIFFNSTGNPGMAKGGSGDVLTGMILSLLAQGYSTENAAIAGVYLHGLAGDIAAEKLPPESVNASDIIGNIGEAFKRLRRNK